MGMGPWPWAHGPPPPGRRAAAAGEVWVKVRWGLSTTKRDIPRPNGTFYDQNEELRTTPQLRRKWDIPRPSTTFISV